MVVSLPYSLVVQLRMDGREVEREDDLAKSRHASYDGVNVGGNVTKEEKRSSDGELD